MQNIRNIAIIAHVDHGKTTLVDKMLYTAKVVSSQHSEFSIQNSDDSHLPPAIAAVLRGNGVVSQ